MVAGGDVVTAASWFSAGSIQSGGRGGTRMDKSEIASISLRYPWMLMVRGVSTSKTTSGFSEPTWKVSGESGTAGHIVSATMVTGEAATGRTSNGA